MLAVSWVFATGWTPFLIALILVVVSFVRSRKEVKIEAPELVQVPKEEPLQVPKKEQLLEAEKDEVKASKTKKCCSGGGCCSNKEKTHDVMGEVSEVQVFYGTESGTAEKFAEQLVERVGALGVEVSLINMKDHDPETLSLLQDKTRVCLFVIPTYEENEPPETAAWFCKWIRDAAQDFRVSKSLLANFQFAVFGLGDSAYGEDRFCVVAKWLSSSFEELGASRLVSTMFHDLSKANAEQDFDKWTGNVIKKLFPDRESKDKKCGCNEEEKVVEVVDSSADEQEDEGSALQDLEDLGNIMELLKKSKEQKMDQESKEMITPALRQALTKQGYKLIGTHSGVKLCRWTKSMLRGRGGCYKHTFYGIESHRCMETTPSLACANKCVFCWRHQTNPVGTEWKWAMDPPDMILSEALEKHAKMINEFKGVPGVIVDRFQEGMSPKHCALSLVGEPIMYPEIDKYLRLLHSKGISSFLVTNAQFPDAIRSVSPVTQLYVSVDASTKQELKRIDRPLFRDFWDRFLNSLKALKDKKQRTVYRLTLVKSWNAEEIDGYVNLVALGNPDFIEIKGVTYCGTSKNSALTMENVPWHEEVVTFVKGLVEKLPEYEIACEHEHSNCVLVAHKKFFRDGKWMTWIDYEKFHELMRSFYESDGKLAFSSEDYMAPTPDWAVFGATEQGFDPAETRTNRKKRETAGVGLYGGHTFEMMRNVTALVGKNSNLRVYLVALTDPWSAEKALEYEHPHQHSVVLEGKISLLLMPQSLLSLEFHSTKNGNSTKYSLKLIGFVQLLQAVPRKSILQNLSTMGKTGQNVGRLVS
ncbi:unnamed protein product [Notodromas monacha]|uniref:S-adenosyl-L-methionine-dependent tRNA 4-demethylwyosine synthase TYW1 n=1 Tax=Notodromas monacha TaxID=399045 RepID=A0A7R9BXB0_9CRUS|nr:unnamed protein product [Notodromas monacha]CAG0921943.1 unnamed protein product [Notodromas monacha]